MENRFGFRDLVMAVLLLAVIVTLLLAMKQDDRQLKRIRRIEQKLRDQARGQSRIQGRLERIQSQLSAWERRPASSAGDPATRPATRPDSGAAGKAEGEQVPPPFPRIRAARQQPEYAPGDWLVRSFPVTPERLTPLVSSGAYADVIQSRVLQSLARRDPDTLEWRPLVARGWTIERNVEAWRAFVEKRRKRPLERAEIRQEPGFPADASEEKRAAYIERRLAEGRRIQDIVRNEDCPVALTIRFTLRPEVRFSDGEPLTARDVAFTFDWLMNPKVNAPRARAYFEKIEDVEATGRHRVAFHFREPYFEALQLAGGMRILPEHFYSEFSPSEFNEHPGLLMGSGPYQLPSPTGWRPSPGEPVELSRNPRYWGPTGTFEKLVYKTIEKDAPRLTAFRNGELDTLSPTPKQFEKLLEDEPLLERTRHFAFLPPDTGYRYIGWNQKRDGRSTPFADRRVRRAMTRLTPRKKMIEQIVRGYGRVVTGPFSPVTSQSSDEIEPFRHDPARARELLESAGYRDRDGDGVRESSSGEAFRFELLRPADSDTSRQIASLVKDAYARAGIVVQAKGLPWKLLLQKINNRAFDAVTIGWTGSVEGDPYQIFHSSQIEGQGDNYVSYANPELDRVIERARRSLDREKRMRLWHEAHRILHEDQPYTFLYAQQNLLFVDDRFRNVERTRMGLTDELTWYVPAAKQKWTQ